MDPVTTPSSLRMTEASQWRRDVPVAGQKVIEADPRIVDAFKNIGYSLEASIADLVDNSIDAKAKFVLIRFLRTDDDLVSLVVVDNGRGMRGDQIEAAMQFGGRRGYSDNELGMYGMGLKSASLSQADSVTVLSKAVNSRPVGMRWTEQHAKEGWKCDIVTSEFAMAELGRPWGEELALGSSGTIIRWDQVRDFQKATQRVDTYLRRIRIAISNHLGLQLHRFIGSRRVRIVIDTENIESGEIGIQTTVSPLDPFLWDRTGAKGYPKTFHVKIPETGNLDVTAHIWPARSKLPGYKLGGGAVSRRQGLYFYRNDRLIQAGGWNNLRDDAEPHVSLARVMIDLPSEMEHFFSIRFSKSGVDTPRSFVDALAGAIADDGTAFTQYVENAIDVYRSRGARKVNSVVPPGPGLRADVRQVIRSNLYTIPRDETISVSWDKLPDDQFFEIDRESRSLTLNIKFRNRLNGTRRGSRTDAPLVKTLLYLLLNDTFRTKRESAAERTLLDAYQAILVAAAQGEER